MPGSAVQLQAIIQRLRILRPKRTRGTDPERNDCMPAIPIYQLRVVRSATFISDTIQITEPDTAAAVFTEGFGL